MYKVINWFRNLPRIHHRLMMQYLRKRGWVVFYLEEQARTCTNDLCWLRLYQSQSKKER